MRPSRVNKGTEFNYCRNISPVSSFCFPAYPHIAAWFNNCVAPNTFKNTLL
jgi:hypothetical protein